jgi:hypothetical protein
MLFDRARNIIQFQAELLRLNHELLKFVLKEFATLRSSGGSTAGYKSAAAGMDLNQAFGYQVRDDFVGCTRIDFQFRAELTDGGEWITGGHLPGDDGFLGRINDLLIERHAGLEGKGEGYQWSVL